MSWLSNYLSIVTKLWGDLLKPAYDTGKAHAYLIDTLIVTISF